MYYTHVHNDLRESLDHVLVSEQFYDNSRRRLWLFDGLIINNDHINEENHRETGTGDHGIVRVDFAWNPADCVAPPAGDPQRGLVTRSSTRPANGIFGVRHTCRCSKGQA